MNQKGYDLQYLRNRINGEMDLKLYGVIPSTSLEAREYAACGGDCPCVFVADGQTAGKGRVGRSFYSPEGTGVYLSLLLPDDGSDGVLLTSVAAVAVRRAILSATGKQTRIKWVNDLYFKGKKICGILTERVFFGSRSYIIIGVGINLSTSDFPKELENKAGSLGSTDTLREELVARVANELYSVRRAADRGSMMEEYRRNSMVLGRIVTYIENGVEGQGVATDVNELGHLLIRGEDGSVRALSSGEISLKME